MKKILFINDHPITGSHDSYMACSMAEALVRTGEYEILMFGQMNTYQRPYGIPVDDIQDRWTVHSILGENKENHVRRAVRSGGVNAVFLVGDFENYVWVYSVDNEIRKNVPIVQYATLKEYSDTKWITPYVESVDMLIAGDENTGNILNCEVMRNFVDIGKSDVLPDDYWEIREKIFGDHKEVFLWSGSNDEGAGLATLLGYWKGVVSRDPNKILLINTDDAKDGAINIYRLMNSLDLTVDNVKVLSDIEEDINFKTMYKISDYTIDIPNTAAFPRSILESMAHGTRVIRLDTGYGDINKFDFKTMINVKTNKCLMSQFDFGFIYNHMPTEYDFITAIFDTTTPSDVDVENDCNTVIDEFSFKADEWVNKFNSIMASTDLIDRANYIKSSVFEGEVKSE